MTNTNKYANSGVHANVGMEFQKHCVILILLENFDIYKARKFFIILEHHEDIIFAFLDKNDELELLNAYQAKKSSKDWTRSSITEILYKLITNVSFVRADSIPKATGYQLAQYFTTNNDIVLKTTKSKVDHIDRVNETNPLFSYTSINQPTKEYIEKKLQKDHGATVIEINELQNTSLHFVDLNRKAKDQRQLLIGKIQELFENRIADHKAAYSTLMYFLNESEKKFNAGGLPSLLDFDKRIESPEILSALKILTTKSKAFEIWRAKQYAFSKIFSIGVFETKIFELHFENSFDKFKDITEAEHQKIYTYVVSKEQNLMSYTSDEECLESLLTTSKNELNSKLTGVNFKAAICAAFLQFKETKNEESIYK